MSADESLALEVQNSLVPVEARQQIDAALDYCRSVVEIAIQDEAQNNAASVKLREIGETVKALEKRRRELKAPWADKATAVDKAFKPVTEALGNLDRKIRAAMSFWHAAEEAKREKARREAEAKAEVERAKAEEKAQAERAKAEQYRAAGRTEMAERAEARAEYAVERAATTVAPTIVGPKVAGTTMLDHWTVKVVDKNLAVACCMANPLLVAAIVVDVKFLETLEDSKAIRGNLKIAGCEVTYTPRPRVK